MQSSLHQTTHRVWFPAIEMRFDNLEEASHIHTWTLIEYETWEIEDGRVGCIPWPRYLSFHSIYVHVT